MFYDIHFTAILNVMLPQTTCEKRVGDLVNCSASGQQSGQALLVTAEL